MWYLIVSIPDLCALTYFYNIYFFSGAKSSPMILFILEHKYLLARIEAALLLNSERRKFNLQVGGSNAYTFVPNV